MDVNINYCESCLETMERMEDCSIDLVVTSPPYEYGKNGYRAYDKKTDWIWNEDMFKKVAEELFRVIKEGGVVVWVVGDKTKNGTETLTAFKQAIYFNEIGFNVNDTMIWEKTNPMPQVKQPRYNQTFEYMFVFSKGKPKTFNPIMVTCKSAGFHYTSTCKQITQDGDIKRKSKDFHVNSEKVDNNIWEIAVAQNNTNHPAVFPVEIPIRHIKSWTNEGDVVYDPFMGSGTTALAAIKLNRKWIGSEISEEYCNITKKRLEQDIVA